MSGFSFDKKCFFTNTNAHGIDTNLVNNRFVKNKQLTKSGILLSNDTTDVSNINLNNSILHAQSHVKIIKNIKHIGILFYLKNEEEIFIGFQQESVKFTINNENIGNINKIFVDKIIDEIEVRKNMIVITCKQISHETCVSFFTFNLELEVDSNVDDIPINIIVDV